MENIWSFLLQTLSVSLIGLLLLVVKLLLRNRLSPRWQYAVWGVLAVRLMVPASTYGKDIFLPLPLWVETVKLTVEQGLSSAYTAFYEAVRVVAPVPWLSGGPVSVTDWLFLLYILGVFGMLGWELFASLRLRRRFQNGEPVSAQEFRRLQRMGEREGRTICAAVFLPQLTSPMVCGVFHPVLGLPANKPVEETAILHAFLYPTRWNILQSGFWRVCRALHWCNPVMWFFLRQVNHDWVSFCDHQVLERLQEGYDPGRLTGTSAIFDGEKDLKEQAEAAERRSIAPKGRTLVAVCVTVVLLCSSLLGTVEKTVEIRPWWEGDGSRQEMVAISHCNPCTTAAGALDTYAKGMMQENPLYCAMASPKARRKQLEDGFLRGEGQKTASETVLLYPAVTPLQGITLKKDEVKGELDSIVVTSKGVFNIVSCSYIGDIKIKEDGNWYKRDRRGDYMISSPINKIKKNSHIHSFLYFYSTRYLNWFKFYIYSCFFYIVFYSCS